MNWNWMRGILAPIDAFLYKRRAEQLEKLTEDLMLQVMKRGDEPFTTVGEGTNQFVLRILSRAGRRYRDWRIEEDARRSNEIIMKRVRTHQATRKPGDPDPMVS